MPHIKTIANEKTELQSLGGKKKEGGKQKEESRGRLRCQVMDNLDEGLGFIVK